MEESLESGNDVDIDINRQDFVSKLVQYVVHGDKNLGNEVAMNSRNES
jgi:hypothetical protein